jgi:hypothetical protein
VGSLTRRAVVTVKAAKRCARGGGAPVHLLAREALTGTGAGLTCSMSRRREHPVVDAVVIRIKLRRPRANPEVRVGVKPWEWFRWIIP